MRKKVSIIGGSNSAHTLIPLLSKAGYDINLLTSKPEKWNKNIRLEYQSEFGDILRIFQGNLNIISEDPSIVLKDADFIILCMPVAQYKSALNKLAPFIDKNRKIYLGTIYGQGGFNWMVDEVKQKFGLDQLVTFAFGLIPWVARTKEYGKTGITYGPKARNVAAVFPQEEFKVLNDSFFNDVCFRWFNTGKFHLAENFISLTLSVDNQIIHPSRIYGLYLKDKDGWASKKDIPYFYMDYDDLSAELLKKVDDDFEKIREKIRTDNPNENYEYMLDYLSLERFSYNSQNQDIKTSFTTSKTLRLIGTPVVQNENKRWEIDRNHRFFTDDIFYGLCIAKWFAEQYAINVPMIDKILAFSQKMLGITLLKSGKLNKDCTMNGIEVGIPEKYHLSLKDSLK